eukprot:TRINITY_DN6867_c0_g1_i1.p1 TRINITY_DN6867_c0_g1~~TRINITY_DN6867_c0_g1_i1.p1  ORF type:complete len:255 (+),score=25.41 TRINITY_DN6867_c0_g1_i1:161-925(+)
MSRDAGWSWVKVLNGSRTWAAGNRGSILIFADDLYSTNSISFTLNEGLTFTECSFTNQSSVAIRRIISLSPRFLVIASRGEQGVVWQLDFTPLHEGECQGAENPDDPISDYEYWEPSDALSGSCLLGRRTEYIRRKQNKLCINTLKNTTSRVIQNCSCRKEDYICDYCFTKNEMDNCVLDSTECPWYDPHEVPSPCIGSWNETQGYRLAAGDTCDISSGLNLLPITRTCEGLGSHFFFFFSYFFFFHSPFYYVP